MTELEEFVAEYERQEDSQDMHHNLYKIPNYYLEEGEENE